MADDPYLLLVDRLLRAYDSVCTELARNREELAQNREEVAKVREKLAELLTGLLGMKGVGDKASTALQTVADAEIARLRVEELALLERKDEREQARLAETSAREADAKRGDKWFSAMRDAFTHPAVISVLTILSWYLAMRLGVPVPPSHDP
jgi:hypothetical protein